MLFSGLKRGKMAHFGSPINRHFGVTGVFWFCSSPTRRKIRQIQQRNESCRKSVIPLFGNLLFRSFFFVDFAHILSANIVTSRPCPMVTPLLAVHDVALIPPHARCRPQLLPCALCLAWSDKSHWFCYISLRNIIYLG